MTETIFPSPRHVCRPGWRLREDRYLDNVGGSWPEGTIEICDCGRSFVAYRPYANVFVNSWRAERRWERRRRERRERRAGGDRA